MTTHNGTATRQEVLPPHAPEAEEGVLGSVLKHPRAIRQVADLLEPTDFYAPKHRLIWQAMTDLQATDDPIDYLLIADQLKRNGTYEEAGGLTTLAAIDVSVPSAAHIVHYAKIVVRTAALRRLISLAQNLAEAAYADQKSPEEVMAKLEERLARISRRAVTDNGVDMADAVEAYYADLAGLIERAKAHDWSKGDLMAGYATGLRDLDVLLLGLRPGDLIYVAARTSVGKTVLAHQIAMNVARQGGLVYYASLEMSVRKLMDRSLTMLTGVPRIELMRGNITNEEKVALDKARSVLAGLPLRWDTESRTSDQIRRRAERWAEERGQPMGLLVVDYVQLLEDRVNERSSTRENVSLASRNLKAAAEKLNCCVMVPAQVSREVLKRKVKMPDLSDLKESGNLEQDADIVLGLDREDYYEREAENHIAQLAILKHRDASADRGRGNAVPLAWVARNEHYGDLATIGTQHLMAPLHDDTVVSDGTDQSEDVPWQ